MRTVETERRLLNRSVCPFLTIPFDCFWVFLEGYGILKILPCSPSLFIPIPEDICGADISLAKGIWMRVFPMHHCWFQTISSLMERFSPFCYSLQCLFIAPHLFVFLKLWLMSAPGAFKTFWCLVTSFSLVNKRKLLEQITEMDF